MTWVFGKDRRPITVESFDFSDPERVPYYADTFVEGWHSNYRFPGGWKDREVFEIGPDGLVEGQDLMSGFLGPPLGRDKVTLKADYPAPGEFAVFVPEIFLRKDNPGPPQLTASLDGQVAVQETFDVDPENARRVYRRFAFAVPEGPHAISIENTGGGFFPVGYGLLGFVRRTGPDLEVRGQQTRDIILLWLKSPKLTWLYARMGVEPDEQPAGGLVLTDVPDGAWVAEWLDTIENEWIRRSIEKSRDGRLRIETPPIRQSVAIRLFRGEGRA